ncbi:MAG: GspH/FimT family protein [Hylemonella sp.]|nr:GspH/FimT family protein [Hylemonella sp.]
MNLRARSHGFTLIELIMVLMLLGVLAVVLVPRINPQDFGARGFYDETLALLRYAQKTAIAQRRTVCVALNAGGVALTIDQNTPPDLICDGPPILPNLPRGGDGLAATVAGGGAIGSFQFTPLGSTNQAGNVTISMPDSANITVDAETGYVR